MVKFLTNGRRDLFSEVKAIIDRHEINNMEHLSGKRGPSIKNQFDEFKNMFNELRKEKQKLQEDDLVPLFGNNKIEPPSNEELDKYQKIIDELVIKRYTDEDNAFLRITEMDYFEQFRVYQDKYPLYNLRMKIWNAYM
jgi:cell fate regulator YaaT (PSP1 superfamily)